MFKIQSNNNAVAEFQLTKEIAGIDARRTMEEQIRINKGKLSGQVTSEGVISSANNYYDLDDARKHLKDFQRNYDRTCPETLTIETKNAMWKRAKQLKDEFTVGMLSHDELHPVKGIQVDGAIQNVVDNEKIATNRTVERNTQWYNRNSPKLSEFKNIMRHLCPDDPLASDIEKFRPKTQRGA